MARVTFEGRRYPLLDGERALDALLRGGAGVRFSCRRGACHTCVLRTVEGDPGDEAGQGLSAAMRERGYMLPCVARPRGDLTLARPDPSELFVRAEVRSKTLLTPDVVHLSLEPETNMTWRAGQYVNVRLPHGAVRSYSIASVAEEDPYLDLYVRRVADGTVSRWLCDELREGDALEIQGPLGRCHYDPVTRDQPMLLLATGTGLAPLFGVARDALLQGHAGEVHLYHGVRAAHDLFLSRAIRELEARHARFRFVACVSGDAPPDGAARGRVTDVAFARHCDLSGWAVYLCGLPAMVYDARTRAVGAGARRDDLRADPFEPARPYAPDDPAKLARIAPDPELWAALREGPGLTEILEDFYGRAFEDPRIAPFFHRVSRQRAIEKQYEFLASVISGSGGYMGLNPFNAHHWMVISDDLFDHREALMEACLRRYGLPEHLLRRWGALHETFRREIVKATPRGLILRGVELPAEGYREELVTVGTLCDGCGDEMAPGVKGHAHVRTGELFCLSCGARKIGMTSRPPAMHDDP